MIPLMKSYSFKKQKAMRTVRLRDSANIHFYKE